MYNNKDNNIGERERVVVYTRIKHLMHTTAQK